MTKPKHDTLLPLQTHESGRRPSVRVRTAVLALTALGLASGWFALNGIAGAERSKEGAQLRELEPFYSSVETHDDLCVGGVSHSGYIGLKGDTEDTPKRSFFWYVPFVGLYHYLSRAHPFLQVL